MFLWTRESLTSNASPTKSSSVCDTTSVVSGSGGARGVELSVDRGVGDTVDGDSQSTHGQSTEQNDYKPFVRFCVADDNRTIRFVGMMIKTIKYLH